MAAATERGTVLGSGATLTGRVAVQELSVAGRFDGTLEVKGLFKVEREGRVNAVVRAKAVEIDGTFDGEIEATSLVFGATAQARGRFRAERLAIRDGARVDGAMNLPAAEPAPPKVEDTPAATQPAPQPVPVPAAAPAPDAKPAEASDAEAVEPAAQPHPTP